VDTGEAVFPEVESRLEQEQLLEKQSEQDLENAKNKTIELQANNVIGEIDKAIGLTNGLTAGRSGDALAYINVEGDSAALRNTIETIKANIGFDKLQQMRDMSPTGGALGQVSERELSALQAVLANLTTNQSPEYLKENLEKVKTHYNNWVATLKGSNKEQQFSGFRQSDIDLINKYK
jgi:hypothetical protein